MRPHSTRAIAALAVTAVLSVSLSGCAGSGTRASSGDDSAKNGVVELNFWHGLTGPDGPALQRVVKDFNASQKQVKVTTNVMPWDSLYEKLLTSIASDHGPDIIAMSANRLPQFAAKGALASTDDFYNGSKWMDTSTLAPAAIKASTYDGHNYGVPLNLAPVMMYWNKDLFSAAGLDPNKPPTTWDEFFKMAPRLTVDSNKDGKPEKYAMAVPDHETIPVVPPLLWNNGGGIVSPDGKTSMLNDPATLQALTIWTDAVRNQKISPVGLSGADADQLFQTGKAAIEITGPWMTTGFDEAGLNYGVTRPFAGPTDNAVLADVVSMAVSKSASAAKKDAAYKFFAYWNSVKGQTTWANGSGFPPNRTDVPASSLTNKNSKTFGSPDVLKDSRVYLPGVAASGDITDTIFNPSLQTVFGGRGSVKDVFGKASKEVQSELDK